MRLLTQGKIRAGRDEADGPRGLSAMLGFTSRDAEAKLDGTILTADADFPAAMGRTLDEVRGRHRSTFVAPASMRTAPHGANAIAAGMEQIARAAGQVDRSTRKVPEAARAAERAAA